MGEVLLARSSGIGGFERRFVIKLLHRDLAAQESTVNMFMDEARISASLQHPNIVQVIEIDRSADGVFMVLEFLHGRDLLSVLRTAARRDTVPLPAPASIGTK